MTTTKDHRSTLCRVYAILIDLADRKRQERPRHISQVLADMNPCDCPDMTIYKIEEATTTNEHDHR